MGLLDRLGLSTKRFDAFAGGPTDIMASPWQEGSLNAIALEDIFGADIASRVPLSRAQAMTIPSVAKVRNLLVSTIMRFPLVDLKFDRAAGTDVIVTPQPTFLYRTNMGVSPQDRMAWTIDDSLFYGNSLWAVERGAGGQITKASWVPQSRWTITRGNILIDEEPVSAEEVLLFNPPFEGLLNLASRTMRGARFIEEAWVERVQNPIPLVEYRVTDGTEFGQSELDEWGPSWRKRHQPGTGGSAFTITPDGVELVDHGSVDPDLYIEARNALRTDIGSFANVRASMLDGTIGIDSLTYTTNEGEKNSFYEFDLPFWTIPIEARLSEDDVVPAGQRIRFDKYDAYHQPTPTDVPTED